MTPYDETLHAVRDAQIAILGQADASIEARLIERGHILNPEYSEEEDAQEAE